MTNASAGEPAATTPPPAGQRRAGPLITLGHRPRTAGLRLSTTDILVLAVAAASSLVLWPVLPDLSIGILVAVGHFFLFCNVVRVRRSHELAWCAVLACNLAFWTTRATHLDWPPILLTQAPATIAAILAESLSPRYHGIASRAINKRLPDYLSGLIP